MMSDNDNLEVYIFQGHEGERVPPNVEKLIVDESVRMLPDSLCMRMPRYPFPLRQMTLPYGLQEIGRYSFHYCENLSEISTIPSTVKVIGEKAFHYCQLLKKVEFEDEAASTHQIMTIEDGAFSSCRSLQSVKPPSSLTCLGRSAFDYCAALTEANLSNTRITEIYDRVFYFCNSLQTVSLPNTLERIGQLAFGECFDLVTVVVPLNSRPITVGNICFLRCRRLVNFALPKGSTTEGDPFSQCKALHRCFGTESTDDIVASLTNRFEGIGVHELCYDHCKSTVQELEERIMDQPAGAALVDRFGTTPFHVFFSTPEPNVQLFEVLLRHLSHPMLGWKDFNNKRPLDYLYNNWTDGSESILQCLMIDRLDRWGATSWMEAMQSRMQEILAEDFKVPRTDLLNEAYSAFERYEKMESISILELALWKGKLKSESSNGGSVQQQKMNQKSSLETTMLTNLESEAVETTSAIQKNHNQSGNSSDEENNDPLSTFITPKKGRLADDPRELCRCKSGSVVVIPNVAAFL